MVGRCGSAKWEDIEEKKKTENGDTLMHRDKIPSLLKLLQCCPVKVQTRYSELFLLDFEIPKVASSTRWKGLARSSHPDALSGTRKEAPVQTLEALTRQA